MGFSRKKGLIIGVVAILIVIAVIVVVVVTTQNKDKSNGDEAPVNNTVEARVMRILDRVPLIDGHNDLPWQLRENFKDQLEKVTFLIRIHVLK